MKPFWRPSLERGLRLVKSGIALPYLRELFDDQRPDKSALHISQVGGYIESLAIPCETGTEYLLALRISTELSKAVVRSFAFLSPWPEHVVSWDFDPTVEVPKSLTSESMFHRYDGLLESRLPSILNDGVALYCGSPEEGVFFGRTSRQIPRSTNSLAPLIGEIVVLTTRGARARCPILLTIYRERRSRLDEPRETKPSQQPQALHGGQL